MEPIQADELHRFLRTRRSLRRFEQRGVDVATLERILQTGMHAPSAHNRQPWRFAVLTEPSAKARLAESMSAEFQRDLAADGLPDAEITTLVNRSKNRINEAPVIIILCMDMSEMDSYPDEKRQQAERVMAQQSTALAGLQLQLAVHAEGLGSVWVCAPLFAQQTVQGTLNLPASWEPQGMIFLGHAASEAKPKTMKALDEVVRYVK